MTAETNPRMEGWLSNKMLASYLHVTEMTIWRWQREPDLGFPQPCYIRRRPFTNVNDIDTWLRKRAAAHARATEVA